MARNPFDDEHRLRAEWAADLLSDRDRRLWQYCDVEQEAATQQRRGALTVGEEAEVPDADETLGQNMDEEPSQELVGLERHDLLLAAGCVILPAEGDAILLEGYEAVVRDRDAMGVAGEVVQNVFRPTEGWLGIDDPLLGEELAEELAEAFGVGEFLKRAMELELVFEQELPERGDELTAEDATQNADRQEELPRGSNPS